MDGLRVTAPATVKFLPESLYSLFSRPGKILEAKVETIEGRLVSLFVGEERLEALLSPEVSPKSLHPGQRVRLRVVKTGPPVVLSLLSVKEEEEQPVSKLLKLMPKFLALKALPLLNKKEKPSLETLLVNLLASSKEKSKQGKEGSYLSRSSQEKEIRALLHKIWEEGLFFIPFAFPDRLSWGVLERADQAQKAGQAFRLRLLLSRLGLLEVVFWFSPSGPFRLSILVAREESLKLIQDSLAELYEALKAFYPHLHLETGLLETIPGLFLTKEG